MRKIISGILTAAILALTAHAQIHKTEQAKVWKTFQTAISRSDKRAVAALIELPFEASIIGENSNFKAETRDAFIKNYDRIFTPSRRTKIIRGKLSAGSEPDEFNFELYENGSYHVFIFRK